MSVDDQPDERLARLRDRILALAAGGATEADRRSDVDDLDLAHASMDRLEAEVASMRSFFAESQERLADLSDMLVAVVSFNYEKKARIGDKNDIFDGFAFGLNMLSEELSETTVSKEYITNILESIRDAIVVADTDGVIRTANQAASNLLGYSNEELIGQRLDVLSTGVSLSAVALNGGLSAQEQELTTKTGASVPVSLSISLMRDKGEVSGLALVARDRTESRQAEEERTRLREAMQRQSIVLEELSTPLLPIMKDVLVLPLIGSLDEERASRMTMALLQEIVSRRARLAIIDITGVRAIDAQAFEGLLRAVRAVKLIGAEVVVTGIKPDVARTFVEIDADLTGVVTFGSLQGGIFYALGQRRRPRSSALAGRTKDA